MNKETRKILSSRRRKYRKSSIFMIKSDTGLEQIEQDWDSDEVE